MPNIPPALVPKLEAIGIRTPAAVHWRQLPNNIDRKIYSAEIICNCTGDARRCAMVPFEEGDTPILIGQCSDCGEVVWSYWRADNREWTGARVLGPSKPLYGKGQGA